jgi:RNA-binding protein
MDTLTPSQRRALRAKAHHLDPVVAIGQHGLTPAVLHEIDVALTAHELIKIRVQNDDRHERTALLARICAETGSAPVQQLGKLLIVWRRAPEPAPKATAERARTAAPGRTAKRATAATAPRPRDAVRGGADANAASRRRRVPAAGHGAMPPAKRVSVPHGKSASSSTGASGARRRRKAR